MNSEIAAAGFAPIRRSPRRMICNVQSVKKSVGKTRFAFTAKKPLGYISVEIGSEEGVSDSFIPPEMEENQDIQIIRVRMDAPAYPDPAIFGDLNNSGNSKKYNEAICNAVQDVAAPAMDAFYEAYHASLKYLASTVIDTGTDLGRLVKQYNFGRIERIPQLSYTVVNSDFAKMFDDAFSSSGNLILVNHMKDKGENVDDGKGGKKWQTSGVFDLDGPKIITDKVQAVIEMWREDLEEPSDVTGRSVRFAMQVVDSRQNADAIGLKLYDDDITFADVGIAVFGNSKRSDWE